MEKQNKEIIKPYCCEPRSPRCVKSQIGEAVLPSNDYFVEDGHRKAKIGKGIDLKPYLKASQASTDLASIVARLKGGDVSVINVKSDGLEGDLVGMPQSVNDVIALRDKLHSSFSVLPKEVKDLFATEQDFYEACLDGSVNGILSGSKKLDKINSEELKPQEVKLEEKPEEKVE